MYIHFLNMLVILGTIIVCKLYADVTLETYPLFFICMLTVLAFGQYNHLELGYLPALVMVVYTVYAIVAHTVIYCYKKVKSYRLAK